MDVVRGTLGVNFLTATKLEGTGRKGYLNRKLQRGANGLRIQFPERHAPPAANQTVWILKTGRWRHEYSNAVTMGFDLGRLVNRGHHTPAFGEMGWRMFIFENKPGDTECAGWTWFSINWMAVQWSTCFVYKVQSVNHWELFKSYLASTTIIPVP